MSKRRCLLLCVVASLGSLVGCKDDSIHTFYPLPHEPVLEDAASYNEEYRDSIISVGADGIMIMGVDGIGFRKLVDLSNVNDVRWSHNKWKIIYSTGYDLYSMNPDGGDVRRISQERELITSASPSPNALMIACVVADTNSPAYSQGWVKIMRVDGSGIRTVTPLLELSPTRVVWTPDSKNLIFNSKDQFGHGIFSVSLEDTSITTLYQCPTLCYWPSLTRDGVSLAFTSSVGDGPEIMVLDMVTGQLTQLMSSDAAENELSWSFDGERIVYARGERIGPGSWIGSSIWTVDKDGQDPVKISPPSPTDFTGPCWQQ